MSNPNIMGKILETVALSTMLSGCGTGLPDKEANSCLDDASEKTSSAVYTITDADADCVEIDMVKPVEEGNGVSCFAIGEDEQSAWGLEGTDLGNGAQLWCGINHAPYISCIETTPTENGKVECIATIEEE